MNIKFVEKSRKFVSDRGEIILVPVNQILEGRYGGGVTGYDYCDKEKATHFLLVKDNEVYDIDEYENFDGEEVKFLEFIFKEDSTFVINNVLYDDSLRKLESCDIYETEVEVVSEIDGGDSVSLWERWDGRNYVVTNLSLLEEVTEDFEKIEFIFETEHKHFSHLEYYRCLYLCEERYFVVEFSDEIGYEEKIEFLKEEEILELSLREKDVE